MHTIYLLAKVLHIAGFIVAAGVSLCTLIANNQFWKLYAKNNEQGLAAFRAFKVLQVVEGLGFLSILIGGITMGGLASWAFAYQFWFKVKLGIIVLLLVNGFTLGRISTQQLGALLAKNSSETTDEVRVKNSLRMFQIVQLILFAVIILLSVFRPK
jgi:uncharacterized membrane protein